MDSTPSMSVAASVFLGEHFPRALEEEDEADHSFISEKIITSTKVELIEELEENPQNAEEIAMNRPTDCIFMY